MKNQLRVVVVLSLLAISVPAYAQITSAVAVGNWSDAATWVGGAVPTATDNVVIAATHVITIDIANAACNNISLDGATQFPLTVTTPVGITINGSVTVNATGRFVTTASGTTVGSNRASVKIFGDITVLVGGAFDMNKKGSTATDFCIASVEFAGTTNSNIYFQQNSYQNSKEEFNAVIINKTGGARVVVKSGNVYMGDLPTPTTLTNTLTFISGIIEVQPDTSTWVILNSNDSCIIGASSKSYVAGNLGKGVLGSTTQRKFFPIGDANGYRPVLVRQTIGTAASNRYPYVTARAFVGNPKKDSSTLSSDIDKISTVRYFRLGYKSGGAAATGFVMDSIGISYGTDDGVTAGNQNLRLARVAGDSMKTWIGISQTIPHTTSLAAPPTMIIPDQLVPGDSVKENRPVYVALARKAGTTDNTLVGDGNSVKREQGVASSFALSQNFPNPFNPATSIFFSIPASMHVTLKVYDLIGNEIATLLDEHKDAGNYTLTFDATKLASGVYFYRLQSGAFVSMKKMVLMK
jgi:hypothetical protein